MITRRNLLNRLTYGIGGLALAEMLAQGKSLASIAQQGPGGLKGLPHHAPKAKRVIVLFMSGGMTQFESFDYKPALIKNHGQDLPESYRNGRQKLLGMSGNQARFLLVGATRPFKQYGKSGAWVSDNFPHIGKMADDLCFINSMQSDAVNHDPAMTFMQTGAQLPGRPSMGAWINYGLGTMNQDLPGFVVLVSKRKIDQPLSSRLWDSGFLPSSYQGVQFRASKDAVLYLNSPAGIDRENERMALNRYAELQESKLPDAAEVDIAARISQYEMAFKMQSSIPEVTDISKEPESVLSLYGPDVSKPGSFAANCLLARRLAERDVRFIQLYHPGWDMHGGVNERIEALAPEVDQPAAGLIQDLKNRDMLKDTLVVFISEFGRTCYSQGRPKTNPVDFGREHHRDCFSIWMAGGGIKPGIVHGETDELGFSVVKDPIKVNDFHATMMHLLGIEHEKFTYRFQGRDFRLTDVSGTVVKAILA